MNRHEDNTQTISAASVMHCESVAREYESRDSKLFQAMESDVNNLAQMANVLTILMDVYADEINASASVMETSAGLSKHLSRWGSAAEFIAYHIDQMSKDMVRYYSDDEYIKEKVAS